MAQSLAQIHIHIIFSTKNRHPFLIDENIRGEMHAYLAAVMKEYDCPARIIGGCADHVHILCRFSRTNTVAKIIAEIKRSSSKWIKTKGQEFARFQWQNGYGAFSVSFSGISATHGYIMNQAKHHEKLSFQDEFRLFLRKNGLSFKEEYVWD